jgi:hypothetical protein
MLIGGSGRGALDFALNASNCRRINARRRRVLPALRRL